MSARGSPTGGIELVNLSLCGYRQHTLSGHARRNGFPSGGSCHHHHTHKIARNGRLTRSHWMQSPRSSSNGCVSGCACETPPDRCTHMDTHTQHSPTCLCALATASVSDEQRSSVSIVARAVPCWSSSTSYRLSSTYGAQRHVAVTAGMHTLGSRKQLCWDE